MHIRGLISYLEIHFMETVNPHALTVLISLRCLGLFPTYFPAKHGAMKSSRAAPVFHRSTFSKTIHYIWQTTSQEFELQSYNYCVPLGAQLGAPRKCSLFYVLIKFDQINKKGNSTIKDTLM